MKVDSKNIEFGYELISVLPYAYYLHSIGKLEETTSGADTESLYYFSPKHNINKEQRSWYNTPKIANYPNACIHKNYLDTKEFKVPPYKEIYKNKSEYKKETVIICNRHNIEWSGIKGSNKPINFFDLYTLKTLFELLQDKYQVIYINVEGRKELYDNAKPISMGDFELLKQYPKVINIHDIKTEYSFNELQLRLFANCTKYVTMNGGHAILSAYFGGENIVMSKHGRPEAKEIHHSINSFYRWYKELGDQRVIHVENETKLINQVKTQWVNDDPIINILIRTSQRPMYFKNCMESIQNQTYKNINVFVSIDNDNDYTVKYPVYPTKVKKEKNIKPIIGKYDYGVVFPSNLYLNELHKKVKEGIVMYLDDDDKLSDSNTLELIADEYKKGNELIFWRVLNHKRIIPSSFNWGKAPVCKDISGIGFAYDYKYMSDWEAYKRGDYRLAKKLYNKIDMIKFTNKVLTETQNGTGFGRQEDLITKEEQMDKIIKVRIIKDTYKGQKSKHNLDEVKELPAHVAKQLIKAGMAVDHNAETEKNAKQLKLDVETPIKKTRKKRTKKVNKVIEHK